MSDITLCKNQDCSLSHDCWRFNAPPDINQSYADYNQDEDGRCDAYWDMEKVMEETINSITSTPEFKKRIQRDFIDLVLFGKTKIW